MDPLKKKGRKLFSDLMKIFKVSISRNEGKAFSEKLEKTYDMNSIQLIYPATLKQVRSLKRCVITARTKTRSEYAIMHAIKLELTSGLRAAYDTQTNEIRCMTPNSNYSTSNDLPAEHVTNKCARHLFASLRQRVFEGIDGLTRVEFEEYKAL